MDVAKSCHSWYILLDKDWDTSMVIIIGGRYCLLRIKLDNKWTPIILCGGLAEIDRNRVTVLVNDVEELASIELNEATQELEKAAVAVENADTSKAKLDASIELKKATARVEAINYLS